MNIISHRGNINGPNPEKENRPSYIDSAIQLGYDVEVDLRYINNEFWLGHDEPQFKIDLSWMLIRKNNIWYHCKDENSVLKLVNLNLDLDLKFFCHQSDEFTLTSTGHLWVHNLKLNINEKCIIPLLTYNELENFTKKEVYGICTDFPIKINNFNK
jgi:hypothetical protein